MINHIKVIGICILSLLLCSIETHAVRGGFGGGVGEITEDKSWTETPAGIFGKSEVNIDVGDTTKLIGGAIVSETDGGLNLVTGKLEVEDVGINDYARDEYTGGQVNVNIGGIINGDIDHSNDTKKDDLFNENKYGTIEHSDAGHDKQGVVKGTISGGSVTVGGETLDVAALEDMGINTDSDNIVTITKDESWEESFKVDLINVGVAAEQVDNLVNVVESFTAKVPDHVKADGKEGEDIYRKAIANGMSQDEATSFAGTQEYADLVEIRRHIEQDKDENGRYNPETTYVALNLELSRIQGYYENNCASAPSNISACNKLASILGAASTDQISVDTLNMMISAYEAMLGQGENAAENELYSQLHNLAKDCKDQWLTSPKHVSSVFETGNITEEELKDEYRQMGYSEELSSSMSEFFRIVHEYEAGKIKDHAEFLKQLKDNEANLQQYVDKVHGDKVEIDGETYFMHGSYREDVSRYYEKVSGYVNTMDVLSSAGDISKLPDIASKSVYDIYIPSGNQNQLASMSKEEVQAAALVGATVLSLGATGTTAAVVEVADTVLDGAQCIAGDKVSCGAIVAPKLIEQGVVLVKKGGSWVIKKIGKGKEDLGDSGQDIINIPPDPNNPHGVVKVIDGKTTNAAYEAAKSGGKHSGTYKNYVNRSVKEVEKGVQSLQKQIDEHLDKIQNPKKYIPEWDTLDPRKQKNLLEKKWPDDIKRQQETKDILLGILGDR